MIYIVGHGGDEYMKVLYKDILFSKHINLFLKDMQIRSRVKNILFLVDTCSAGTMFSEISNEK